MTIGKTPYRDTKVSAASSQSEIRDLLNFYDVENDQWTHSGFRGVKLTIAKPDEIGHMNAYGFSIQYLSPDVKGEMQAHRMLYWWLKGLLESIKFGVADFDTVMLPFRLVSTDSGMIPLAEVILPQLKAGGTEFDPFKGAIPERMGM